MWFLSCLCVFFFKQKTAYEMRISDWSSDVCSSDLVKFIKKLAFTAAETDAKIQASGYRVRPVGVKGAPDQPSMWEMKVKSWVTYPLMDVRTGRVQIHGVAFGGAHAVAGVEIGRAHV